MGTEEACGAVDAPQVCVCPRAMAALARSIPFSSPFFEHVVAGIQLVAPPTLHIAQKITVFPPPKLAHRPRGRRPLACVTTGRGGKSNAAQYAALGEVSGAW